MSFYSLLQVEVIMRSRKISQKNITQNQSNSNDGQALQKAIGYLQENNSSLSKITAKKQKMPVENTHNRPHVAISRNTSYQVQSIPQGYVC